MIVTAAAYAILATTLGRRVGAERPDVPTMAESDPPLVLSH